MRRIKVMKWKAQDKDRKEIEENTLIMLSALISAKKPEEMPRGLDKFRTFGRLSKAFEKAERSDVLELEEVDYKFLKDTIESDVPSAWAMNPNMNKAVEAFIEAKIEGDDNGDNK